MLGPQVPFSQEIGQQKYYGDGEGFRELTNGVASTLKDDDNHFRRFRDALMGLRFLPGGRILSAIGSTRETTPYNCYVSGTIADSFVEGEGSIMDRAKEAAATMRMGGGIGYDFSPLRPEGALIKKLQSHSSGPLSFMEIFNATCKAVASAGHRRGAQMGILRVDHPDIEKFIHAKQNDDRLTGFNLSIAVTDEFMQCMLEGLPFKLRFNGEVYREIDPQALWEQIMRGTWDWAEPGVIFIDAINRMNNLWYCETIAATNPCGEQPLPPYGACLLGSFNLASYVIPNGTGGWDFDFDMLEHDIPHVVSAMDNVVEVARFPLIAQRLEAQHKRRMGLGVTGLANAGEALGLPYGSRSFVQFEEKVLEKIRDECYRASVQLAMQKGSFPLYDADLYSKGHFIKTLPDEVQYFIRRNGIRNSHLTSIAPTGTISLFADNISSGIEPVFAYSFDRTVIEASGPRVETVEDFGVRRFGVRGKVCSDVTVQEHVDVLVTAALRVDSAVSKTCNVTSDTPWEQFKDIYVQSWQRGAKGCTTYQVGGKRAGILVAKEEDTQDAEVAGQAPEPATACYIDQTTGRRECA